MYGDIQELCFTYIYIYFYGAVIFFYLQEIYYIHFEIGVVAVRISWSLKYLDKKVIYGKRKLFPSISIGILRVVLKGQFYISKESVISYIFSLRGIGKGSSQSFVTSYPNIQHSPNYGSTRSNLYHQHKSLRLYYITVSTRKRVISFFFSPQTYQPSTEGRIGNQIDWQEKVTT